MKLVMPDRAFGGYIFDCDGTLADTMPLHYRAWRRLLEEHGAPFSEDLFYQWGGRPTERVLELLRDEHGLRVNDVRRAAERKEEYFLELMHEVKPIASVLEIARRWHSVVPMAVASGGLRKNVEMTLDALGIRGLFETMGRAGRGGGRHAVRVRAAKRRRRFMIDAPRISLIGARGMDSMKRIVFTLAAMLALLAVTPPLHAGPNGRWSAAAANAWYAKQPWPLGSNYVPFDAINQLEMWQAATFDPERIDIELGWAQALGMNTMRVFLHNLLWQQDPDGFETRIRAFLRIAARHHIKPIFVLFDSDWDPEPRLGPQHPPIPGVHNSGWVQAPGAALDDPSQYPEFKAYVRGIVGAFANDDRILAWDVWNEPDNAGDSKFAAREPKDKLQRVEYLLPRAFAWARSVHPIQPLTSGLSAGDDWSRVSDRDPVERTQLLESDILSFHDYGWPEEFAARIRQLLGYGRPIVCTEYMARGNGSTIDGDLPIGKLFNVGMINWGLVEGKTQTTLPWDSWQRPYTLQKPMVWFHDLLHADGTPYREREAQLLRELSAAPKGVVPARIWLPTPMPPAAREDHDGSARSLRRREVTDARTPESSRNPK